MQTRVCCALLTSALLLAAAPAARAKPPDLPIDTRETCTPSCGTAPPSCDPVAGPLCGQTPVIGTPPAADWCNGFTDWAQNQVGEFEQLVDEAATSFFESMGGFLDAVNDAITH